MTQSPEDHRDQDRASTLEAFADTIVPGEKRGSDDRVVAGAAAGPGAVAAGALELLELPATGLAPALTGLAVRLNEHATAYAAEHGRSLEDDVPPFVALAFPDRTALVGELTSPGHPEQDGWVALALFSNMAFDTGAHRHTAAALADGHPGLTTMGFAAPDPDGLWRFPRHTYGRALATPHSATTASGSPA